MNRELLVTLLRKDIQELDMITQGFMEMNIYPKAILLLAQRKTEDIQRYIIQLSELDSVETANNTETRESAATTISPECIHSVESNINHIEENDNELIIEIEEDNEDTLNKELPIEIAKFENVAIECTSPEVINDKSVTSIIRENKIKVEKPTHTAATRNESLSKGDTTLSSTLANKKIDDLKQAISIGDRFRFQRELFRGNGEEMNKSLNYINQLATLDEALSFLTSKYGWADDNEAVVDFLQIVQRRFL